MQTSPCRIERAKVLEKVSLDAVAFGEAICLIADARYSSLLIPRVFTYENDALRGGRAWRILLLKRIRLHEGPTDSQE